MSTRCQLGVYENESARPGSGEPLLYRHSDGYPEGVIPDIEPFLNWFNENRGISDTSYCLARLIQRMANIYDEHMSKANPFGGVVGFGIDNEIHGDIEYFYHISPTKIKIFETHNPNKQESWSLTQTIDLKAKKVTA